MEEKTNSGYITKEEIWKQKTFDLKKAVDVSVTGRMAWRTLSQHSVLAGVLMSSQNKRKEDSIIYRTDTNNCHKLSVCLVSKQQRKKFFSVRNKYAHRHYGCLWKKLLFSSGIWERFTCSPLMVWREVVWYFLKGQGPQTGAFIRMVPTAITHQLYSNRKIPLLIHPSLLAVFSFFHTFFKKVSSFSCPGQSRFFPS